MSIFYAIHIGTVKSTQEWIVSKADMGRGVADSGDSKKLHIFRQSACGVSQAVWPAEMRRSPATGRSAQRRRYLVLSGKWWAKMLTYAAHPVQSMSPFRPTRTIQGNSISSLAMGVLSLLVGSGILAALFFHTWLLLLLPTAILTIVSLAITPPLLAKLLQTSRTGVTPGTRELRSTSGSSSTRRFPETPMPTTPLVRELETFDLSQTNVEHFLNQERTTGGHRFHLEKEGAVRQVKQ